MAFHPFHPRKPLKTATSYLATGYHYPFSHCTICTFNRGTTYPSYNCRPSTAAICSAGWTMLQLRPSRWWWRVTGVNWPGSPVSAGRSRRKRGHAAGMVGFGCSRDGDGTTLRGSPLPRRGRRCRWLAVSEQR